MAQQKILFTTKERPNLQPHLPDAGVNGQYKLFVINKPSDNTYIMPLLWASSKTFYETNGKHRDKWHWANPKVDYNDPYKLAEFIASEKPTLVGFSMYVWNEAFHNTCAKHLKELDNNIMIVFGGPHSDVEWNDQIFKQLPYIDYLSPNDAYGEIAFADLLDNIAEHDGRVNVNGHLPYLYYTNDNRECFNNGSPPNKREFVWPPNPFRSQEKYLKPFIEDIHSKGHWVRLSLETSRGCPYKCSFCDWGGGTFRKTNKKPIEIVKDEILWCGENDVDMISITDANFGMFEIDIEYAKYMAETKAEYSFPKVVHMNGPTKVKQHNLKSIYEHLADADMLTAYQISIQDVNDEIKKNVDRVDFPFEDQVDMFRNLQKRKYLPIFIETILGLPGQNIDSMKNEINVITNYGFQYPLHYMFAMLPGTPANDPAYRKEWNIDTVKNKSSSGFGMPVLYAYKEGHTPDPGINMLDLNTEICTDFVVQTSSFTKDDWIEMAQLMIFTTATLNSDILSPLARYLDEKYKVSPGDFLHEVLKVIKEDDNVGEGLRTGFEKIFKSYNEWMSTDLQDLYIDPGSEFAFKMGQSIYTPYAILSNITEFFEVVERGMKRLLPELDQQDYDLLHFSEHRIMDLYNFYKFKTFTVNYDWQAWVDRNKTLDQLINAEITYEIRDEEVIQGGNYFSLDWLEFDGPRRHREYIYKFVGDIKAPASGQKIVEFGSEQKALPNPNSKDNKGKTPWADWWDRGFEVS